MSNSLSINQIMSSMTKFQRMMPTPKSSTAKSVFSTLGDVASSALGMNGSSLGEYADLINTQIQMQQEMMTVTMVSNIEKSQHETRMAPVRNIRVS